MNQLRVKNHKDWEEICKHLASKWVYGNFKQNINFIKYGENGQKQHGVDLVPNRYTQPCIVVQCKDTRSLNINDIKSELKKTDNYPNVIDYYIIFTTASKNTSIQEYTCSGKNFYDRSDGSRFKVLVYYWDDVDPIRDLPEEVIKYYFPNIPTFNHNASSSAQEFYSSIESLKLYVPEYLNKNNLIWLENWDFNLKYVVASDYEPFLYLKDLYHKASFINKHNIKDFAYDSGVLQISKTIRAGKGFYSALLRFCASINDHTISDRLADGTRILTVRDLPNSHIYTHEMVMASNELASEYRKVILGERNMG